VTFDTFGPLRPVQAAWLHRLNASVPDWEYLFGGMCLIEQDYVMRCDTRSLTQVQPQYDGIALESGYTTTVLAKVDSQTVME